MDQLLARIGRVQMFTICLAFGIGIVGVGNWLGSDFIHSSLINPVILWAILPPTCGWKRADLTNTFLASLNRIDARPDDEDCIVCYNTCESPVQLPCGHIICESCLRGIIDHHYESCCYCGKNFFGSEKRFFGCEGRWSILVSKAVVCGVSFVMSACIRLLYNDCLLSRKNRPDDNGLPSSVFGWWLILLALLCNTFIAKAIRYSIHDRNNWWREVGLYNSGLLLEWILTVAVCLSTVLGVMSCVAAVLKIGRQ